jgi:nitric oxide reductase NorD protein
MSSPPPSSDPDGAGALGMRLAAADIERALQERLDAVLSSRRTPAEAAGHIAVLARPAQDFVLHWVSVIARTSPELAFQFAAAAGAALRTLDAEAAERWIVCAVDAYDRDGLHAGGTAIREWRAFVGNAAGAAVSFESAARVLRLFVQGLAGRPMPVETAAHAYTDTERIYLPPLIDRQGRAHENFLLYKGTAALLWAQSRHGTYNADLAAAVAAFDDPSRALSLLNALETVRLEACIARALPGLAEDLDAIARDTPADARLSRLREPSATVHESMSLMREMYADPPCFDSMYPIALEPGRAAAARASRIAREKNAFRGELARILEERTDGFEPAPAFTLEAASGDENAPAQHSALKLDDTPVETSEDMAQLMASIRQDLGDIPDDYLVPSGAGAAAPDALAGAEAAEDSGTLTEPAHVYDEWDYQRRHYRRNWCHVREHVVVAGDREFVETTARKYAGRIAQLKRTFELMRGDERRLSRQSDGDGLDFDALIDAYVDMKEGAEVPSLVFTRRQRSERDLAVMFMIDMSGSTKGWVNDAEREALVMLCEALEALGDRYAIYGFSGVTRKDCQVFTVKGFDEPYGDEVRGRIAGIEPHDYTRMGAAIRHLTASLSAIEARTRLLITLSDGRPDDFSDNYRGEYGIEDTRQALLEAHRAGVKPFCITIDREAHDYLPHMYGAARWALVDDVAKLPVKVAEIYARLTI